MQRSKIMVFLLSILAGCDGGSVAIDDDLSGRVEALEAGLSQVSADLATSQEAVATLTTDLAAARAELATAQGDIAADGAALDALGLDVDGNARDTAAALDALGRRVELLEATPGASIQAVSSDNASYSASAAYFEPIEVLTVPVIAGQSVAAWCVLVDEAGGQYRVTIADGSGWTEEGPAVRASGQATALDAWTATDTGDLDVSCEGQGSGAVTGFSLTVLVL